MSEGKLFAIGSKRTLLLLCLLLVVTFTVLLVTLLREPTPPEKSAKSGRRESPQMVRNKIQLPKSIEVSGPVTSPSSQSDRTAPKQKELPETSEQKVTGVVEQKSSPAARPARTEAESAKTVEPLKPASKTGEAAVAQPSPPAKKSAPAAPKPAPTKTASVEVQRKSEAAAEPKLYYTVQVGAFSIRKSAENLASQLEKSGYKARIESGAVKSGKTFYRVQVGNFDNILEAKKMEVRLQSRKEITSTFVKRIK